VTCYGRAFQKRGHGTRKTQSQTVERRVWLTVRVDDETTKTRYRASESADWWSSLIRCCPM